MRVVDAFCGVGGVSCGALQLEGLRVVMGLDNDDRMLKSWASNTGGRAVCTTIAPGDETAVEWPEADEDVFVHLSPPCTALSRARAGSATAIDQEAGLDLLRWSLDLVIERSYALFSIENVSTTATRAIAQRYAERYPERVAFVTVDCADYGVPQSRVRLLISTPTIVRALKETPVRRVTIADAFAIAGLALPATHIKSNTSGRDGAACLRSVQQQAFTITASHPLAWSDANGQTVRCLTVAESALLQGFPPSWKLPKGSRLGIRAIGNAVPPPLATQVMRCALSCNGRLPNELDGPVPPSSPLALPPASTEARLLELMRRVEALEAVLHHPRGEE